MAKYTIKMEQDDNGEAYWAAYAEGDWFVGKTISTISADDCEMKLRKVLNKPAPVVVREVEL